MNKFEEYKKHLTAIQSLVKSDGKEMVHGFIESLFTKFTALDAFLIVGYTPSFNDGDACTHSQYVVFDGSEISDHIDLLDYFTVPDDCEDEDEFFEEKFEELNAKLGDADQLISKLVSEVEDLFERVHHTDFLIFAIREEDGTINISVEDHNCGY